MRVTTYIDAAGWTWDLHRFVPVPGDGETEWTAELIDGPYAERGVTCGPCTRPAYIKAAIESTAAMLRKETP